MKNSIKQKYVPCQLDVVEFNVERGFAESTPKDVAIQAMFTMGQNSWSFTKDQNHDDFGINSYNMQNETELHWFN